MVKLQESKNRYSITIPKEYIKLKKWDKGTELVVAFNEHGDLLLREIKD